MLPPDLSQVATQAELVKAVLAAGDPMLAMKAATTLETFSPEQAAARLVIEAHAAQKLEPWLAALLLGAIRHSLGYAIVLQILRAGGGVSSETYAGPALARIAGPDAFDDLAAVLRDDRLDKRAYEGAGYGLAMLDDPRVLDVAVSAVRTKRLPSSNAGSVVVKTVPETTLLGWLASDDVVLRAVAWHALLSWSADSYERPYPSAETREQVLRAIGHHVDSPLSASQREWIRERFAPSILEHPAIADAYFLPRPDPPSRPWTVRVDRTTELACARNDRGRAACVLHFHGNGEVVADWSDLADALDERGVDSYFAEYRGYGGSGGRPCLVKLLEDALAVFDGMIALGRKTREVVVYGRSIGSLAAAHVAAYRSVGGLVLESGIHDLHERLALRVQPSALGGTDVELREAVSKHFHQGAKISRSRCPVLILHCEHDALVRQHHAQRNVAAAGKRGQLVTFPHGDHNTIHAHNHEAIVELVTAMTALRNV